MLVTGAKSAIIDYFVLSSIVHVRKGRTNHYNWCYLFRIFNLGLLFLHVAATDLPSFTPLLAAESFCDCKL